MKGCLQPEQFHPEGDVFQHTRLMLEMLPEYVSVPLVLSVLFHDVAKPVTATAQAQLTGDKLEIAGSVIADMGEFGVSPPHVPFVAVDSQVTIEFDVFLTKTA